MFFRVLQKPITIVDILEKAKNHFCNLHQSNNSRNKPYYSHGMCLAILDILREIPEYNKLISKYIKYFNNGRIVNVIIPEFKRPGKYPSVEDYSIYWWDLDDITSRIKYLDDLIEKYRDDSTNIISKDYLSTVEGRFRDILLSEDDYKNILLSD